MVACPRTPNLMFLVQFDVNELCSDATLNYTQLNQCRIGPFYAVNGASIRIELPFELNKASVELRMANEESNNIILYYKT